MEDLFKKEHDLFFYTYKRLGVDIVRGEGMYLYDRNGKAYLDFFGGLAVNALGNAHPGIVRAVTEQAQKYLHLSNFFVQEPQVELVERLIKVSGFNRAFLCNSGTEALEGAVKLARKWGGPAGKTKIYGLSNAFHGRTFAALSVMDKVKYREGYGPFLPGCDSIPFNDVDSLRRTVNTETLAVILEPFQGEGGVIPVSREYADAVNELRARFGFLVIADEVQTGVGRTGTFFGHEQIGLKPDIVMLAKAIGGGLPLGVILGNATVADAFAPGVHGTTFGGNPVSCAAGVVVLKEVIEGGLMKNAARAGEKLHAIGARMKQEFPSLVRETRGHGCMIGIDLTKESQSVADALLQNGILVNSTASTVLRLLPPLIVEEEHIRIFESKFREALRNIA